VNIALITLSEKGFALAAQIATEYETADLFCHQQVTQKANALPVQAFTSVVEQTEEIFSKYDGLVYIMPCGVVTRAIAEQIKHKKSDPAVVVVDVAGRWVVSLLSGHEGGANDLALDVANCLDAEPIITTTTEAEKTLIVGLGCRKGVTAAVIVEAIELALAKAECSVDDVRLLATADLKKDEPGMREAAQKLKLPLRIISSEAIRNCKQDFTPSEFVQKQVELPAVAEPAALLAGRRTKLLLPRIKHNAVTVAIAKESSIWSE